MLASFVLATASITVLAILFVITNPERIGPVGVLGVFGLIYLALAGLLTSLWLGLRRFFGRRQVRSGPIWVNSALVAAGPVVLLALNTLRQLSAADFVLVVIFEIVGLFYLTRWQTHNG